MGDFRLTIIPALEVSVEKISFTYSTSADLFKASNDMATLLLFIQDDIHAMPDHSNVFMKEEWINGEWEDIG